jgi:hypothetical protein
MSTSPPDARVPVTWYRNEQKPSTCGCHRVMRRTGCAALELRRQRPETGILVLRDGQLRRVLASTELDEALEAAGLSE